MGALFSRNCLSIVYCMRLCVCLSICLSVCLSVLQPVERPAAVGRALSTTAISTTANVSLQHHNNIGSTVSITLQGIF